MACAASASMWASGDLPGPLLCDYYTVLNRVITESMSTTVQAYPGTMCFKNSLSETTAPFHCLQNPSRLQFLQPLEDFCTVSTKVQELQLLSKHQLIFFILFCCFVFFFLLILGRNIHGHQKFSMMVSTVFPHIFLTV